MRETRVDSLFYLGSQANMIATSLVSKLGFETNTHMRTYYYASGTDKMQVTQQCIIQFGININYEDEVFVDVVLLSIDCMILGNPYLFDHDVIYYQQSNQYHIMKGEKDFIFLSQK